MQDLISIVSPCCLSILALACKNDLPYFVEYHDVRILSRNQQTINRQRNHAVITCASSDDAQWKITCKDGQWDGVIGDCSGCKLTKFA